MTTEQQEAVDPLRPNVKTFKANTFQLSQFEVVAQGAPAEYFAASEWECVAKAPQEIDPMFEVFDGSEAVSVPETENAALEEDEFQATEDAFSLDVEVSPSTEGEALEEEVAEDAAPTNEEVEELQKALVTAQEERKALEEEHARQLEELRAQVAEETRVECEKQGEERLKAIEERYATLIEDLNTQIKEGIEGVERRAVEFSIQIAKKLVGAIVEVNPEYILGIIKEATKLTGGATIKSIRVSPQDLEFLKMLSPDKQFKEFDGSWSFQADETIHAGCVLETSSGQVEFDLDKAWERIKESVIKVR